MPDIVWEHSADGALGWNTQLSANPSGTYLLVGMDVSGLYIKPNDPAEAWQQVMAPEKIPVGFQAPLGLVEGCYGVDWASDTRFYFVIHDELLRGDMTGADWTITRTALTGLPVGANDGNGRKYWGKVVADRADANVCYTMMGQYGLRRTIDGGTSFTTPTGVPAPSEPSGNALAQHGLIAVDHDSALTSGRRSRVAVCSFGNGIYVSTDGGGSFIEISSTILACSHIEWRGGNLYVCEADGPNQHPTNDIHVWNGASWSTKTVPVAFQGVQHLVPLPSGADDWLLFDVSNFIARTTDDFATYERLIGNAQWGTQRQVRVNPHNPRPMVAKKYRLGQGNEAISRPLYIAGDILWPIGYGTLRSDYANWPSGDSDNTPENYSATEWPTWTEEAAGIEELVALSTAWNGDTLVCLSQDVAYRVWPENGHRHAVDYYPVALTRGTGIEYGPDGSAALKVVGQDVFIYSAYAADGRTFVPFANQPDVVNNSNDAGKIVNLGSEKLVHFSAHPSGGLPPPFPCYTADKGDTAWTRCTVRNSDGSEFAYASFTTDNALHGFHGERYFCNSHRYCRDPATGHLYAVNIGGTLDQATTSWEFDPLGAAGLYRMAANEFGTLRRIDDGHPTPYGNRAYFDCQLIADGQGHLVFMPNPLEYPAGDGPYTGMGYLSAGATNFSKIYDLDANGDVVALRDIETPFNLVSVAFGAPYPGDTQKALWLLGNHGGAFGLWLIRDLDTLTVEGPFSWSPEGISVNPAMASLSAHATEFGLLGVGYNSMGHGRGQYSA